MHLGINRVKYFQTTTKILERIERSHLFAKKDGRSRFCHLDYDNYLRTDIIERNENIKHL